jgi:DNA-binding NtrC family response regulator
MWFNLVESRCNIAANLNQGHDMTEKQGILVVEDDPLVSEVIAAALDDTYPTTIVETAAEALVLVQRGGFRLMLLDCTLPGGVDENLLPEADRAGTAVILMSGDPGRMAKLTDQPLPFVLKPFTLTGLLDTVETVLAAAAPHAT